MIDPVRAKNLPEGGYQGTKVSWYAPGKHSGGNITIDFTNDFKTKRFSQTPSDPSVLDSRLAQCKLIIVKVKNTQSRSCIQNNKCEHWVLVTGKQGNEYTIIDPGKGKKFLSGYGSFWSWRWVRAPFSSTACSSTIESLESCPIRSCTSYPEFPTGRT